MSQLVADGFVEALQKLEEQARVLRNPCLLLNIYSFA